MTLTQSVKYINKQVECYSKAVLCFQIGDKQNKFLETTLKPCFNYKRIEIHFRLFDVAYVYINYDYF